MHDIVTKETWSSDPNNAPLPSDFNRIESNTRKVEENRQEETDARAAADNAEAAARAAADNNIINNILGGLDFINGNAGTFGYHTITVAGDAGAWVIPKGTYMFTSSFSGSYPLFFQIYGNGPVGLNWYGSPFSATGLFVCDGINYRIAVGVAPQTIYYRKLA